MAALHSQTGRNCSTTSRATVLANRAGALSLYEWPTTPSTLQGRDNSNFLPQQLLCNQDCTFAGNTDHSVIMCDRRHAQDCSQQRLAAAIICATHPWGHHIGPCVLSNERFQPCRPATDSVTPVPTSKQHTNFILQHMAPTCCDRCQVSPSGQLLVQPSAAAAAACSVPGCAAAACAGF